MQRMEQRAALQQSQHLMMLPQMQQALHILQLPLMELLPLLENSLEQNPLVEEGEDSEDEEIKEESLEEQELNFDENDYSILDKLDEEMYNLLSNEEQDFNKKTFHEQSIVSPKTLLERLLEQSRETFNTTEEIDIAEKIIGNLDADGFLTSSIQELLFLYRIPEKKLRKVLKSIQTFEPYGIAAQSLQECLLNQLQCLGKEETLAYSILSNNYDALLRNRIPEIQKTLNVSFEQIDAAIRTDISPLDFRPGRNFSADVGQWIIPDLIISHDGETLSTDAQEDAFPSFRLNAKYLKILTDKNADKESKSFLREHLGSIKWLMKSFSERNSILTQISNCLIKYQHSFFTENEGTLQPLTMKKLAEELSLHESTIARAVSNKYVFCPKGTFPLHYFFPASTAKKEKENLSSHTICKILQNLIQNEDKKHPLSDMDLCKLLQKQGIICARRTVAKYRMLLNEGNAQQRRKFK